MESWSGEQFSMTTGSVSFLSQTQQDHIHPHTTIVTQWALQNVDMLPWPARSTDLSPIEHEWNIIERQLQHHPQPVLSVPVLTLQVQHAWNSIPPSDIRCLYNTMHAPL
ncbi:uncharacterized protein TNCV_2564311 [Trichonephila clavipes]|nr:uncharacterized protein TNCV_2564311 [Trichonephila clavipes]